MLQEDLSNIKHVGAATKLFMASELKDVSLLSGLEDCSPYKFSDHNRESELFKPTSEEKIFSKCINAFAANSELKKHDAQD